VLHKNILLKSYLFSLFSITFLIIAPACGKDAVKTSDLVKQSYLDVAYGSDNKQKMDVFLPAGRTTENTKTIIFIHGGSWNAGDKADFNDGISALRDQLPDFAIFNVNYRLASYPNNVNPSQINDVQSAIEFIKDKSSDYNINANKIVLIGASAGAHLALLQAYKNNADGKVKAVVDLFGPVDLTDLYNNHPVPSASQGVLFNYLGTTPAADPLVYQQSSPINYVSSKSVPTQIFHGEVDPVVPISQSLNLKAKLQAFNVKVEMTAYAGEGHGWFDYNTVDTYTKVVTFIRQNVQ
jgi:acetyl esterase/lipase